MASISTLIDRVKIFVNSSGTGPFSLGSAVPAFRGIEVLSDGFTYSYAVENGSNFEAGTGVYIQSTGQFMRSPTISSQGGSPVSFPAGVQIAFTALAQDLVAAGGDTALRGQLAQPSGATLVGAAGSEWATVADFIAYVQSDEGASALGTAGGVSVQDALDALASGSQLTVRPLLADLEAVDVSGLPAGAIAMTVGYGSLTDGGGGTFVWRSSDLSVAVANDPRHGVYVPPASNPLGTTGAWVRLDQSNVRPQWFGAVANGVADDADAVNACIAWAAANAKAVFIPAGGYFTSKTINQGNVSVVGEMVAGLQVTRFISSAMVGWWAICARKDVRNIEIWSTLPMRPGSRGFIFGNGPQQFARNVVSNLSTRYFDDGFYGSADIWGNSFTKLNADLCGRFCYNLISNPSGTTNSFDNIYGQGVTTRGTMSAGGNTVTVGAETTSVWGIGQKIHVMGAGANRIALAATITAKAGNVLTLDVSASFAVTNARVFASCTGWASYNFSDLTLNLIALDGVVSNANGIPGAFYSQDVSIDVGTVRFEGGALVAAGALVSTACLQSRIGQILSYLTIISAGNGIGYIHNHRPSGSGANNPCTLGSIQMAGDFDYYSGGILHSLNSTGGLSTVTIEGGITTGAMVNDNGYPASYSLGRRHGRMASATTPNSGVWSVGDTFQKIDPTVGAAGGVCTSQGMIKTLNAFSVTGAVGSYSLTANVFAGTNVTRGDIIQIGGAGRYTVMDFTTSGRNEMIIHPALSSAASAAAVTTAAPVFALQPALLP